MIRGTHKHRHGAEARLVRSEREVLVVVMLVVFIRGPEVERLLPGPPVVAESGLV